MLNKTHLFLFLSLSLSLFPSEYEGRILPNGLLPRRTDTKFSDMSGTREWGTIAYRALVWRYEGKKTLGRLRFR
jgi:hypothetical protein